MGLLRQQQRLNERKARKKRFNNLFFFFVCCYSQQICAICLLTNKEKCGIIKGCYLAGRPWVIWPEFSKSQPISKKFTENSQCPPHTDFSQKCPPLIDKPIGTSQTFPYAPPLYCRPLTATSVEFPTETPFRKKLAHMALKPVESYFSQKPTLADRYKNKN